MELIGSGREAEVFALGPDAVLRRYRDGRSAETEAAVLRELADVGYPVPRVHRVDGADLVMDRVLGDTLATQLTHGSIAVDEAAALVADLLHDLHRLTSIGDRARLHLDLHPLNVLMSPGGPVVIDWTNSKVGEPGRDIAMTTVIMAQASQTPSIVAQVGLPTDALPRFADFVSAFMARVTPPTRSQAEQAVAFRSADLQLSAIERAQLAAAVALVSDRWQLDLDVDHLIAERPPSQAPCRG